MCLPPVKFYAEASRTTIAKCQIYLAVSNYMILHGLDEGRGLARKTSNVRETLDKTGVSAILAVGYEEC
jgi:hypothetical protein